MGEILERRESERGAPNSGDKLYPSLQLIPPKSGMVQTPSGLQPRPKTGMEFDLLSTADEAFVV